MSLVESAIVPIWVLNASDLLAPRRAHLYDDCNVLTARSATPTRMEASALVDSSSFPSYRAFGINTWNYRVTCDEWVDRRVCVFCLNRACVEGRVPTPPPRAGRWRF